MVLALIMLCSVGAMAEELNLKVLDSSLYPVAEGAELDIWCGQDGNVVDYAVNPENAALEALTGVKINWTTAPGTQADMNVMFNLHIASGNYPDMYLNSFATGDVMTYANDVFIPLNEYIENTRWIKEYLEESPEIREAITAPDGNIYCLWRSVPSDPEINGWSTPFKLWIYKPWLAASGMDMPETVDEFREYLRYIRDNDMNGNGDSTDELPMFGSYAFDGEGSDPTYAIMNAFQLMTPDFLWADEDHTVSCVAVTEEYREGLKYLNSMFEEGLISEDIYALTLNEYRDVVNVTNADDMVVAVAAAPEWMRFATVSIYGERLYDDFTYVPVLKKDENSEAQTYQSKSAPSLYGAVTTACEDPQLAIDWIDACIDPELSIISANGNEDEYWQRKSAEGEFPVVIESLKDLKDSGSQNTHTFGTWVFPATPASYTENYYEEGTANYKMNQIRVEANKTYLAASKTSEFPAIAWCDDADLITERAELQTTIENAISTAYAEFILGRKDIDDDAEWQAYLDNLEVLGLSRYLEVVKTINFGE